MPAALVIYRRRSEEYLPKKKAFQVPNWLGWIANIWAVVVPSMLCIFFTFPMFLPVTAENMSKSTENECTSRTVYLTIL